MVAFLIIPFALRLIPVVAGAVRKVLGERPVLVVRCAVAISIAILMESIIALAVTLVQHGVASGWLHAWGTTFLKALPLGLLIGFTMTFIVQPRMHQLAVQASTEK